MADSLESVNAATRLFRKWGERTDISEANRVYWAKVADALDAMLVENQRWKAWARPVPSSYGDLSDLPEELLSQLTGVKTDELEDKIFVIAKAAGDSVDLDKILIELFRRFGDVHQRRFLMNKCYRMTQKGIIHLVPGRKGVYSVKPQASSAAEADPLADPLEDDDNSKGRTSTAPRETFSVDDDDDEIPF